MRIATNTHSIGVPTIKQAGNVELRVSGLMPVTHVEPEQYARNSTRLEAPTTPHTSPLKSAPQTPNQLSAALRVLNDAPASGAAPWFATGFVATAPYMPQAFKGILPQAMAVMVAARLAPFILPTVALASALFPRPLGDASLYVPSDPSSHGHVDGFRPLEDSHPVLKGVPHTQYTRPPTPHTRELPITDTSEPQLHVGGEPVDVAPVPGKARTTPHWTDSILLANEVPDTPDAKHVTHSSDSKEILNFLDVVVHHKEVEIHGNNGSFLVPDKRLELRFQTGKHGEGTVSARLPDPNYIGLVEVEIKKTPQLSSRLAGEILARTLGYTDGLIPERRLHLKVENTNEGQLASVDATSEIARWAMAFHGKAVKPIPSDKSDYLAFFVSPNFRTHTYAFEQPTTASGYAFDGPGLNEPTIFRNFFPSQGTPPDSAALPENVIFARDLNAAVGSPSDTHPGQLLLSYVIPVLKHADRQPETRVSVNMEALHDQIAQSRNAYGAGSGFMVFDPLYGPNGGFRTQLLFDKVGPFSASSKQAKATSEAAFQAAGLDGDGRWVSWSNPPVSVAPFAGLHVIRYERTQNEAEQYEIRIPDATAVDFKGAQWDKRYDTHPDFVSIRIEPVMGQSKNEYLAHIRDVQIEYDAWGALAAFVGQALAAIQLKDPTTGANQSFTGVRISENLMHNHRQVSHKALANALTIYGIENQLGDYSPEVDFTLKHVKDDGTIDIVINPEVSLKKR